MTATLLRPHRTGPVPADPPLGWRARRRLARLERTRLTKQDDLAVLLAELHQIRALLQDAVVLVSIGWIQNAWFSVTDARGVESTLTGHDVMRVQDSTVSGVCLVGGIVQAGGGPLAVRTQVVQRALDLAWHALHEDTRRPVRWCPSPDVRMAHVRDLTRWNDHPHRTREQVAGLLQHAVALADAQIEARRTQALEPARA